MPETYYDQLTIRASLIDDFRFGDTSPYVEFIVVLPGSEESLSGLQSSVEALARPIPDQPAEVPFHLDGKTRHVSWGADGAQVEFAIEIAKALGYTTLYEGLKHLILKFPGRFKSDEPERRLTDEEFIQHGARLLAIQGGFRHDELHATGIELNDGESSAKITYLLNGEKRRATVKIVQGIPILETHYRELS